MGYLYGTLRRCYDEDSNNKHLYTLFKEIEIAIDLFHKEENNELPHRET